MLLKQCVTCNKAAYPMERLMISDLWIHKQGCLKCSVCSTTLSLSSVYVAASPVTPFERLLYCAKDVPKIVHTSVVDSVALKTAMSAPKMPKQTNGIMGSKKSGGNAKSIRFKGLTLRSKAIKAGLSQVNADIQRSRVVIGTTSGTSMDSWDIVHAMSTSLVGRALKLDVQSQVSAPIRDHPAIHAQHTGGSASAWAIPSLLSPQQTGMSQVSEIASAKSGDEPVRVEPDLVKNLIRVFQLESLDTVEITHLPPSSSPLESAPKEEEIPVLKSPPPESRGTTPSPDPSNYQGTLKSTFGRSLMGSMKTIKTLGSRNTGSCRGTLTLAQMKGNLRRPALSEIFMNHDSPLSPAPSMLAVRIAGGSPGCTPSPPNTPVGAFKPARQVSGPPPSGYATPTNASPAGGKGGGLLRGSPSMSIANAGLSASGGGDDAHQNGLQLLQALLPLAAHLIPLPSEGYEGELEDPLEMDLAREELVQELEDEGLELVMLFEEEPELAVGS